MRDKLLNGKVEGDVYVAIADDNRRKMIYLLANEIELPLYRITPHFKMGRTAVSKHLTILRKAGLVKSRRVGRETRYQFNGMPLKEVQDWVTFYEEFWTERITKLQSLL